MSRRGGEGGRRGPGASARPGGPPPLAVSRTGAGGSAEKDPAEALGEAADAASGGSLARHDRGASRGEAEAVRREARSRRRSRGRCDAGAESREAGTSRHGSWSAGRWSGRGFRARGEDSDRQRQAHSERARQRGGGVGKEGGTEGATERASEREPAPLCRSVRLGSLETFFERYFKFFKKLKPR